MNPRSSDSALVRMHELIKLPDATRIAEALSLMDSLKILMTLPQTRGSTRGLCGSLISHLTDLPVTQGPRGN